MKGPIALVFGARGAIGSACASHLEQAGVEVVRASRDGSTSEQMLVIERDWTEQLPAGGVGSVIWAQGANSSGSVLATEDTDLTDLFDANVAFVARTARALNDSGRLANPCRFVVVSSVWQELARPDKLAYTVSKAAVAGLVRSMAVDLAVKGISVNAVLPGVLDTPMARANLSREQMDRVAADTPAGRLARVDDVAATVRWLTDPSTSSVVTGQFIAVDGGWSVARNV